VNENNHQSLQEHNDDENSPLFEARDVSVKYGTSEEHKVEALNAVNWKITKGEFVSFIGPSGCGKTTMLKLISGLIFPSSGVILHKGKPILGISSGIGMAFQDTLLLPWRNVLDNVLLPIEILRRPREEYRQTVEDLLSTVGLKGFENKNIWELSGGMRQRVSLCRALIASPEVVLLDEPFAALDAFTREDLWLVLQELHTRTACTMILITHQLNEAVFLSDRIFVVSKRPGRITYTQQVNLSRPRVLNEAFSRTFLNDVESLRNRIER